MEQKEENNLHYTDYTIAIIQYYQLYIFTKHIKRNGTHITDHYIQNSKKKDN